MTAQTNRSGMVVIDIAPGNEARFQRFIELVKAGDMEGAKEWHAYSTRCHEAQRDLNSELSGDPLSETHKHGTPPPNH